MGNYSAFLFVAVLLCFYAHFSTAAPIIGPYKVKHQTFINPYMDITDHHIDIWYPLDAEVAKFPFISYAHGDLLGGDLLVESYGLLLSAMASFGYVIGATRACNTGCLTDISTLKLDPPGFGHFYRQQLGVIAWSKNQSGVPFDRINFGVGVGIAGHSMGGQATLFSAGDGNPEKYDIRAAVMHHPYTHSYPSPTIPFVVFTGTSDHIAPANPMATKIFYAEGGSPTRGMINKLNSNHFEPTPEGYNNLLPQYSVAWFKVYLEQKPQEFGINFEDLVFGNGTNSVCGGGDGQMAECMLKN